jgi:hypothetical protein
MEIAAPAVLVGKHAAIAGGDGGAGGGDGQLEERRCERVTGSTPVEAGVRDEDFHSGDEQGEEGYVAIQ